MLYLYTFNINIELYSPFVFKEHYAVNTYHRQPHGDMTLYCTGSWNIWRVTWDTTKHDSDLICFCCFCGIVRVENWKYNSRVLSAESHKQTWHTYYSENQSVNFKDEQTILPDRWIYSTHNTCNIWTEHTRLTTNRCQPTSRCHVRNNNQIN